MGCVQCRLEMVRSNLKFRVFCLLLHLSDYQSTSTMCLGPCFGQAPARVESDPKMPPPKQPEQQVSRGIQSRDGTVEFHQVSASGRFSLTEKQLEAKKAAMMLAKDTKGAKGAKGLRGKER